MDTVLHPKREAFRVGIFGVLATLVVGFLLGVNVGLHPTWIPFPNSVPQSFEPRGMPLVPPATQPANVHLMIAPQTQPAQVDK
jgi:hypothetical protein